MRNLKKILALVLALVMVVGMMSIATAAKPGTPYVDDAAIVNYDEAIQVLTALGVYRGDEKGNFNPNATITRGEFAAIVYRIVHDDVNDVYAGIYADYNKFDDVKASDWNAGYINYCANGEYILGDGAGNFLPNGKVNGYQVLAVMLRALGYDKEGEFQGAGWEVRTARKAKELGITTTVTEGTLGAPATRALVAELVYRSIAKASTVNYIKLVGYVKTGATLGWEVFGLFGGYDVEDEKLVGPEISANDEGVNSILEYADYSIYNPEEYGLMVNREPAKADTKYGEPVAYWYATDLESALNPYGAIEIRFNPAKIWTTAITDADVYAAVSGLDPYGLGAIPVSYTYIDGVERTESYILDEVVSADVYAYYYETPVLFVGSGSGTVTEAFAVEGKLYIVIKNTYADWVSVAYNKSLGTVLTLDDEDATIDANTAAKQATLAGIAKGTLVLYNKYGEYVDYTTIHTAPTKVVTLTNSYVDVDAQNAIFTSYFKAGKDTYTYDYMYEILDLDTTTFAPTVHADAELLDRDELAEVNYTQQVYFDDYGYVIYAENVPAQYAYGWMLVTNATYGGYSNDNGYFMTVKGYDLTGKAITVKGGFDTFVYATKTDAQDYSAPIGLYYYDIDLESGLVNLVLVEEGEDEDGNVYDALHQDWDNAIMASDPDTLDSAISTYASNRDVDYLVTNETVFVVAKYNKSGLITGYEITKGFKNIKDMTDAEINGITGAVKYTYGVTAFDLEGYYGIDDNGFIDFVFVTGAKQTPDKSYKSALKDLDEVFFLVNDIPEKQFAEYDLYYVVKDGKLTTMKVDAEEGVKFYEDEDLNEGFYIVTDENDDYVVDVVPVPAGYVNYVAEDILEYEYGYLWNNAACEHGYITLADDAKIINVTTCTEIAAEELLSKLTAYYYGFYYAGVAAEYNQYGEVTVLYVVAVPVA